MQRKIQKKLFIFQIIASEFGFVNLSLLRTEYLSAAFNALRKHAKVLHITMRAFFQLICLHSDQYIW